MTEADGDLLHEALEQFWLDWQKLVNGTHNRMPEHLRENLLLRMQEKATVYGALCSADCQGSCGDECYLLSKVKI